MRLKRAIYFTKFRNRPPPTLKRLILIHQEGAYESLIELAKRFCLRKRKEKTVDGGGGKNVKRYVAPINNDQIAGARGFQTRSTVKSIKKRKRRRRCRGGLGCAVVNLTECVYYRDADTGLPSFFRW